MNEKKFESGKDFLDANKPKVAALDDEPKQPIPDELAEVHTPDLSSDSFRIADKEFKLKLSNIKTQKIMTKAFRSINDLMAKIDIRPIIEKYKKKLDDADKKAADIIKRLEGLSESALEEEFKKMAEEDSGTSDTNEFFFDFADLIKEIIIAGGIDNIAMTIMDLIAGCVYAICHGQDARIDIAWIEDNLSFKQAQDIFFKQMEKDEMQGRAIDFLAVAVHLLTQKTGSTSRQTASRNSD